MIAPVNEYTDDKIICPNCGNTEFRTRTDVLSEINQWHSAKCGCGFVFQVFKEDDNNVRFFKTRAAKESNETSAKRCAD